MKRSSIGNWIGGFGLIFFIAGFFCPWVLIYNSYINGYNYYSAIAIVQSQAIFDIYGIEFYYYFLYGTPAIALISVFGLIPSKLSPYIMLISTIISFVITIFLTINMIYIDLITYPDEFFVISYGSFVSIFGCHTIISGAIVKLSSKD